MDDYLYNPKESRSNIYDIASKLKYNVHNNARKQ